jgi:hypothetical protein
MFIAAGDGESFIVFWNIKRSFKSLAASCELRAKMKAMSCGLRAAGCGLRARSKDKEAASYKLEASSKVKRIKE